MFGWNLGIYAICGAPAPRPVCFDRPDRMGVRHDGEFVFHKDDAGVPFFEPLVDWVRLLRHIDCHWDHDPKIADSSISKLDAKATMNYERVVRSV